MARQRPKLQHYRISLAGSLLAAREAVMTPIRPILREANITEQQWRVLRVLADEGSKEPTNLALAALLHPPTVTRILRELTERGLVVRDSDPLDGRRYMVSITPSGINFVSTVAVHTITVLERFAARFGASRLETLRVELLALSSAIADISDE